MTSDDLLPVPAEYQQSSQRFCIMWEELVDREEKAGYEIVSMVRILESNGYSRTKAIEKIILDHSHLKGFSRMTIYRKLSDNMKRKYDDSTTNILPNNSDVSFDTFESESQQQPIDVNDMISTTTNDDIEVPDDAFPMTFVKEYVSKEDNNSKIQEYECQPVYNGVILPLSITLNVTKQKPMSIVLDNDKFKVLNKTLLMDYKSKK